jgi:hypothetical protein
MTEAAILRAPAEGFGIGASCAARLVAAPARDPRDVTECAE